MKLIIRLILLVIFLITNYHCQAQYNLSWNNLIINYKGVCNPMVAGIVIDENENVYTCWSSPDSINSAAKALFISKYSHNGTLIWSNMYQFQSGSPYGFDAVDMKISGAKLYVGGWGDSPSGNQDMFISAIDTAGNFLWERLAGVNCSFGYNLFSNIAVTPDGGVILSGYSFSNQCLNEHSITIKYDSLGNNLWNSVIIDVCYVDGLFVDSSGNTYVGASRQNGITTDSRDLVLLKYDPYGNLLHETRFNSDSSGINADFVSDIHESPDHSIWLTGQGGVFANYQCFLITAKFDTAGNLLHTSDERGFSRSIGYSITFDSTGNCYVTGTENTNGTGEFIATIKYDTTCQVLWKQLYGPPGCIYAHGIENWTDHHGNVYTAGFWSDSLNTKFEILQYDYTSSLLVYHHSVDQFTIVFPPNHGTHTAHQDEKIYYALQYLDSGVYVLINTAKLEKLPLNTIEEINSTGISIFPNPLSGSDLYLNTKLKIDRILIYNIEGKQLYRKENPGLVIGLENLQISSGLYVVKVESGDIVCRFKLVKE